MAWYDKLILAGLAMWIGGGICIIIGFYGLKHWR